MLAVIQSIFSIGNLLMMIIGVGGGIIIGVLPGLGTTFAITVLLPMTFGMNSYAGMFLLLGAYCGSMYGGSITAILINTPGTTAAVTTTFDGYPLAEQGRAGDALKAALYSSYFGGTVSALALLFLAPQLSKVVNLIASPEYFSLCIFGMIAAISIGGGDKVKGLIAAAVGLLANCVGLDPVFGTNRMAFGNVHLMSGFQVATIMLGSYAFSTVLIKCREAYFSGMKGAKPIEFQKATIGWKDIFRYWKSLLRSSIFGIVIGAIPGTGGALSAMLSYNEARRGSKHPERFGTGEMEGVVAAECGNNAVTGATLIPLLTMGIPGDAAMGILLGALTMQGITPGVSLFSSGSVWVYAIMGGLLVVNLFMLLEGVLFIKAFANVTRVPLTIMMPCIIVICSMGAFALNNSTFDILVMIGFGFLGFLMKTFKFPIPPLGIAMVLGSLMENNLRRSLQVYRGDWFIFFKRPLSLTVLILCMLFMFMPQIKALFGLIFRKKRA